MSRKSMSRTDSKDALGLEDPLVCKLCGEFFNDPLFLQCGHSCCSKCVDHMVSFAMLRHGQQRRGGKVDVNCPTCSSTTEVDCSAPAAATLKRNRDLGDEAERRRRASEEPPDSPKQQQQQQQQASCQMDCGRPATLLCVRCSHALFCAECSAAVHMSGVFRSHEPRTIGPGARTAVVATCPEHANQELQLFCIPCGRPVCLICAQFSKAHKGHECAALVEHGAECRRRMAVSLGELGRRRAAVAAATVASANRRQAAGHVVQEAREAIASAFERIEVALHGRRDELLRQLTAATSPESDGSGLQHALQDMSDYLAALETRFAPQASSADDAAVATAAHELEAALHRCEVAADSVQLQAAASAQPHTQPRVRISSDAVLREIRALGFVERPSYQAPSSSSSSSSVAAAAAATSTTTTTTTMMMPTAIVSTTPEEPAPRAPGHMLPSLRFHATQHGPNVSITEGGRRAARLNSSDTYNSSVVVLSEALLPGACYMEVVVTETTRKWAGSLSMRFFTELSRPLPPCIQTNLMETFAVELAVGDRVALQLDDDGQSILFVRGRCLGHVTSYGVLPTDRPLYGCIDLYGKVTGVCINVP